MIDYIFNSRILIFNINDNKQVAMDYIQFYKIFGNIIKELSFSKNDININCYIDYEDQYINDSNAEIYIKWRIYANETMNIDMDIRILISYIKERIKEYNNELRDKNIDMNYSLQLSDDVKLVSLNTIDDDFYYGENGLDYNNLLYNDLDNSYYS